MKQQHESHQRYIYSGFAIETHEDLRKKNLQDLDLDELTELAEVLEIDVTNTDDPINKILKSKKMQWVDFPQWLKCMYSPNSSTEMYDNEHNKEEFYKLYNSLQALDNPPEYDAFAVKTP